MVIAGSCNSHSFPNFNLSACSRLDFQYPPDARYKSLEVIVLTMAAYGAILFVVPDYLDGCLNMHPMGEPGCTPPFTPFYFFFVYFGVLINWIWALVPGYMLWRIVQAEFAVSADPPKKAQ
jgi:hypothetical protein